MPFYFVGILWNVALVNKDFDEGFGLIDFAEEKWSLLGCLSGLEVFLSFLLLASERFY